MGRCRVAHNLVCLVRLNLFSALHHLSHPLHLLPHLPTSLPYRSLHLHHRLRHPPPSVLLYRLTSPLNTSRLSANTSLPSRISRWRMTTRITSTLPRLQMPRGTTSGTRSYPRQWTRSSRRLPGNSSLPRTVNIRFSGKLIVTDDNQWLMIQVRARRYSPPLCLDIPPLPQIIPNGAQHGPKTSGRRRRYRRLTILRPFLHPQMPQMLIIPCIRNATRPFAHLDSVARYDHYHR
jgi:hypothetical protein